MKQSEKTAYSVCYCAAMLFLGLSASYLAPLVTRITDHIGISLTVFSMLLILKSLTFSMGSFMLGPIQQKFPPNKMIAVGLLMLPFISLIYPQTHSKIAAIAALLLWGLVSAFVEGGVDTQNSKLPEALAGRLNYLQYAALSIGAMAGPALLSKVMQDAGTSEGFLRLPFYTVLPVIVFAVWIWHLPEPGAAEEAESRPSFSGVAVPVIAAAMLMFFACGSDCALNDWSPTAVYNAGITDEATAALLPTLFALGALLSRFISAVFVKKIKIETIFTASVTLTMIAALGMLAFKSLQMLLLLQFLFGFGNGAIFSSLLLLLRKRGYSDGGSIGFIIGLKNIGDMVIPLLTGIALDHIGAMACFTVVAVGCVISFLLHFAVRLTSKKGIGAEE